MSNQGNVIFAHTLVSNKKGSYENSQKTVFPAVFMHLFETHDMKLQQKGGRGVEIDPLNYTLICFEVCI